MRHLLAYDLRRDRLYGHIKLRKGRSEFLAFCRYIRSLYPAEVRLHLVLDNFSAHQGEVREWAADNNVELAFTPHYASWLNRIEAQFKALRYFCLAGTDHPDHAPRPGSSAATSRGATATPTTRVYARSSTRRTLPDAPLAHERHRTET